MPPAALVNVVWSQVLPVVETGALVGFFNVQVPWLVTVPS